MTELTKNDKIRVVVVEDHPIVRAGIRSALEACERLEVVAEGGSGEDALLLARELSPDVIVMDIELPDMDGLDVTELMKQELPDLRIVLLSMHENAECTERAMRSGAGSCLLKNTPLEKLVESVLAVGESGAIGGGSATGSAGRALPPSGTPDASLTRRDKRILRLVAAGKSNREIAAEMGLKEGTARSYRSTLKMKLGIPRTAGLVKYAIARGLVPELRPGQDLE